MQDHLSGNPVRRFAESTLVEGPCMGYAVSAEMRELQR
jgi:hypothetical protein